MPSPTTPHEILNECHTLAMLALLHRTITLQLSGCPLPFAQALLWEAHKMTEEDILRILQPRVPRHDCRVL